MPWQLMMASEGAATSSINASVTIAWSTSADETYEKTTWHPRSLRSVKSSNKTANPTAGNIDFSAKCGICFKPKCSPITCTVRKMSNVIISHPTVAIGKYQMDFNEIATAKFLKEWLLPTRTTFESCQRWWRLAISCMYGLYSELI